MASVIIPRTPLPGPLFACGHPWTDANTSPSGQCAFCHRVRAANYYFEHEKPSRRRRQTIGDKIVAGLI